MRRIIYTVIFVGAMLLTSCAQKEETKFFTNPILAGFYPDPSVCRVGDDFYLVNSSFSYFPGIPVFHSRDLVNWNIIGHVMDRTEQMNLEGLGISRGIFAPAISHNNGTYYVVCTLVDAGGNFVVTAKDPAGPWSNPVFIPEINGIDPSLYFDDDGKAYILYNSIPPDNKPLYNGHRTIRMYEFSTDSLNVIGKENILINGGTDITKKPIWIEGPHIYKVNGYFYLMAAEGGTGDNHSEVIFRSDKIEGPYESYGDNPILTQRNLNPARKNAITSTGHADIVQVKSGDWWAVFLGCRPYPPEQDGFYNTGRETFLAPVKWIDGWPVINPDSVEVQYRYPYPAEPYLSEKVRDYSGNFIFKDDFDSNSLGIDWIFLRNSGKDWCSLTDEPGSLTVEVRPEACSGSSTPSFVGHRQQHLHGSVTAEMEFEACYENEKAGLLVFQNEQHYYFLAKSVKNHTPVIQLLKSSGTDSSSMETVIAEKEIDTELDQVYMKIEADNSIYNFSYSFNNINWMSIADSIDAAFLSTKVAGGFVGCIYAMYATSNGKRANNNAVFNWIQFENNEELYKQD